MDDDGVGTGLSTVLALRLIDPPKEEDEVLQGWLCELTQRLQDDVKNELSDPLRRGVALLFIV